MLARGKDASLRKKSSSLSIKQDGYWIKKMDQLDDKTASSLQQLIPPCQTRVLMEYIQGWAIIIQKLVTHFDSLLKHEKKLYKLHVSTAQEFSQSTPMIFQQDGVAQGLFNDLYEHHTKLAAASSSCIAYLESHTLTSLHFLAKQVDQKLTEFKKEWSTHLDASLQQSTLSFIKLHQEYTHSLHHFDISLPCSTESVASHTTTRQERHNQSDPWFLHLLLRKHVNQCIDKQKEWRQDMLDQQHSAASFQIVLFQHLRHILSSFLEWKHTTSQDQQVWAKQLCECVNKLNPEEEWKEFLAHHADYLPQPDTPLCLDVDTVVYYGKSSPLTEIIRQGSLYYYHQGGLFKKSFWKCHHCVLTPSGFLHGYDIPIEFHTNQDVAQVIYYSEPSFSLFLPDFTLTAIQSPLSSPDSNLFPHGAEFQLVEKPGSGLFQLGKPRSFRFLADTLDKAEFWWDLMEQKTSTSRTCSSTFKTRSDGIESDGKSDISRVDGSKEDVLDAKPSISIVTQPSHVSPPASLPSEPTERAPNQDAIQPLDIPSTTPSVTQDLSIPTPSPRESLSTNPWSPVNE